MPSPPDAAANGQKPVDGDKVLTYTGVVVIGRNEGDRLQRCLASLLKLPPVALVYVDSGSTDNSVSLAMGLGVDVVELDPAIPFSMARARNTGFSHLLSLHPDLKFVQFVDGDCELEADWLFHAQRFLNEREAVVTACGHLRECSPQSSIYNRLADMEWQGPVGEIAACGGIAMYRADAFKSQKGFDENMIAGEEADLCSRIRQSGGKIWRLDYSMALHDAAMTRFRQWWIRTKRNGFARAYGLSAGKNLAGSRSGLQILGIVIYGLVLPVFWLAAFIYALLGMDMTPLMIATALVLLVLLKPVYGAFTYRMKLGNTDFEALLYAIFCTLGKVPEAIGVITFVAGRLFNRRTGIIEYKSPSA